MTITPMTTTQLAPPAPRHPAPADATGSDYAANFPPQVQAHLDAADRHFAAGEELPGSAELWQASFCALRLVASRRGWQCETMDDCYAVVHRLGEKTDDPSLLPAGLAAPELFRANAEYDFLEDYEIPWFRRLVLEFIGELLDLMDTPE